MAVVMLMTVPMASSTNTDTAFGRMTVVPGVMASTTAVRWISYG